MPDGIVFVFVYVDIGFVGIWFSQGNGRAQTGRPEGKFPLWWTVMVITLTRGVCTSVYVKPQR